MKTFVMIFLAIVSFGVLIAAPFDTGFITWTQPNGVTFIARLWGDEFQYWFETQSGHRIIQSSDNWYYYATLNADGEYTATTLRVGIDSPPSSSYKLERSATRIAAINQQIAEFQEQLRRNAEWFAQKQAAARALGQPVVLRLGVILVEFQDVRHYRDTTNPDLYYGYKKASFDSMLFSTNYWYKPNPTPQDRSPHPENEPVFGSFRDYWEQMSRGQLIIQGTIINPTEPNGVPRWIYIDTVRSHYHAPNWRALFNTSYRLAVDSFTLNPSVWTVNPDSNHFDRYIIIFAGHPSPLETYLSHAWWYQYHQLPERWGYQHYGETDIAFGHSGVHAHEFGHVLGLDRGRLHSPPGNYCLMNFGIYNGPKRKGECPATLAPYYRIKVNWIKPDTLKRDTTNFIVRYDYENPKIYKIIPFESILDEHYLIETRLRQGFDLYTPTPPDSFPYQPGILLIWHNNIVIGNGIDDDVDITAADNMVGSPYGTDFFPKDPTVNRQSLNDITVPKAILGHPLLQRPAHFALNGIRRHRPTSPSDSDYTIIDTIALKLTMAAGTISSNTTWQYDVRVLDNVIVASGVTLTIMPGTKIKFEQGKSLTINGGKLIAKGAPSQRIIFTSSNPSPSPGAWTGIWLNGGGPDTLEYCDIKYASSPLVFINTAANSYMEGDTVSYSSGYGISVSNTSTSFSTLKMYQCGVKNNLNEGIQVSNARVNITTTRIENNGAANVNRGIYVLNGGKVYLDSSRIQNDVGSGIEVTGSGSRVALSADEIKKGFNTLYQHGVSELYVRNSATALLGYTYNYSYCDCIDPNKASTPYPTPSAPCPPGCSYVQGSSPRAGWNNVYNTYTHSGRLINNATTTTIQARYTYWGTHRPNEFIGPVDTLYQLGTPVNTPAKMGFEHQDYLISSLNPEQEEMIAWLRQLKDDIENNAEHSIDALHQLALYVGPGGDFQDILGMPWEAFLGLVESSAPRQEVRTLATVLRLQEKLDRGLFRAAIAMADQVLRRDDIDDDTWLYCQSRKIIASVGLGDFTTAQAYFDAMRARGELIDAKAVEVLQEYLTLASVGAGQQVVESEFIKPVEKKQSTPMQYSLAQNYPNPFNPVTRIAFSIPEDAFVQLKVYNILGQEVITLINEHKQQGEHEVFFEAKNLPSGVYYYKLTSGLFTSVKKMLLIR